MAHSLDYITKRIIELYYISDERPLELIEKEELLSLFDELVEHFGLEWPVER